MLGHGAIGLSAIGAVTAEPASSWFRFHFVLTPITAGHDSLAVVQAFTFSFSLTEVGGGVRRGWNKASSISDGWEKESSV